MTPRTGGALRGIAAVLGLALAAASISPAVSETRRQRAHAAAGFIVTNQNADGSFPGFSPIGSTSDAVLSLVSARRAPQDIDEALDYLESVGADVDTIGERAKVVMALVAGRRDPRSFEGRDLVEEILATETDEGRFGAATPVFEHALALLALIAADEPPSAASVAWLVGAQCGDNGWQFDNPPGPSDDAHCNDGGGEGGEPDFFTTDTNTTSLAVQALAATGGSAEDDPFRYFRRVRDDVKRGWGFNGEFPTDTISTALVIQAYSAGDKDLPRKAMRALKDLQDQPCFTHDGTGGGGFSAGWEFRDKDGDGDGRYRKKPVDVASTIAAVLGLLKEPYPVPDRVVEKPVAICTE